MTFTYSLATDIGKIRLNINDKVNTSDSPAYFSDEEIEVFLANHSDNINLASAELLEAWAAKYAASADSEKIGDYSYSQKIVDKMLAMAKRLRDKDNALPAMTWSELDLTGEEE